MRFIFLIVFLFLSSISYSLTTAFNPNFINNRHPYVMNITTTEATLLWKRALPSMDSIRYGKLTEKDHTIFEAFPRLLHEHRLENLESGTCYFYSVYYWNETKDTGNFCTAPKVNYLPVNFVVIGDSGIGSIEQYRLANLIHTFDPTLMLHVGDVIYPSGEAKLFNKFYFNPYKQIVRDTPIYLTLGNHDIATKNGKPYFEAFDLPKNNRTNTEQFYSFEWGNVLFISLDSNSIIKWDRNGKIQLDWLKEELKNSNHRWRFIFLHHPIYASMGKHGSTPELQRHLLPIIKQFKIQAVFSGHDHHFERTKIIDGTLFIVSGGGGAAIRPVKPNPEFSEVAISKHHFVNFFVTDDELTLTAIDDNGNIIDQVNFTHDEFNR